MFTEVVEFCYVGLRCHSPFHFLGGNFGRAPIKRTRHTEPQFAKLDLAVIVSTIGCITTKITKITKTYALET